MRRDLEKKCDFAIDNFWSKKELNKVLLKNNLKKPKIITAIGMFYDLEDPNKFIKDSALALNKNGIFIAQLMCLKSMINKNLKEKIAYEAQNLNMLKEKVAKLPL